MQIREEKEITKECRQRSPMTDPDHVNSIAMTVNLHTCEMEQWGQFNEVIPVDSSVQVRCTGAHLDLPKH